MFEIQLKVSYSISLESLTVNTICKDTFFPIKIVSFGWLRMKHSKKLIQVKDENILDICLKLVETNRTKKGLEPEFPIFSKRGYPAKLLDESDFYKTVIIFLLSKKN